jgi:hypothetical protein
LVALAVLLGFVVSPIPTAAAESRYFPETGFTVEGRFLAYWETNGGLAHYGYPISDPFEQVLEDGKAYRVQYFERARMEYHPEHEGTPSEVLLGQFGRRILAGIPDAPTDPAPPKDGFWHFPETGHNVGPRFAEHWRRYGGLAQFGLPLTESFEERLEDGKTYTVQYFERARFEVHYDLMPDVLLGHLGRRVLDSYPGEPTYQVGISLSSDAPAQESDVTVSVSVGLRYAPVADYRIETTWHFPLGARTCNATVSEPGLASCTLNIGSAPVGVPIRIDATAILPDGTRLQTKIAFTPTETLHAPAP